MSEYEVWFFLLVAIVILFVIWYLLDAISNLNRKFKYLDDRMDNRMDDCAKKWSLERTDREAKEMREHIDAIEKHLGITLVEEPARLVVKTGEPK
jgi:predicted Holliday junction resolvase-like endonuclease